YSAELALDVTVGLPDGKLSATVKPRQVGGKAVAPVQLSGTEAEWARGVIRLRRLHQLLEKSSAVRDLENELYQLEQVERLVLVKQLKQKSVSAWEQAQLARLGRLREVGQELRRQRAEASAVEDAALVAFQRQTSPDPALAGRQAKLAADWDALL